MYTSRKYFKYENVKFYNQVFFSILNILFFEVKLYNYQESKLSKL